MAALGRLAPAGGIAAMQSINVAVLNPMFFGAFFGTAALSIVLVFFALVNWSSASAVPLLAGSLLYLIGSILVTIVFNVPLNNRLAAVAPESTEGARVWQHYLRVWTVWNHVRTAPRLRLRPASSSRWCARRIATAATPRPGPSLAPRVRRGAPRARG